MRVFVSHSRVNSSMALRLCDALRERKVDTWMDARDLEPGTQWDQGVVSAIESAAGFVFLIGPPGPGDRWQTFEWQQVVNHEFYLDPSKPLIPVLVGDPDGDPDDDSDLPGFLKTRRSLLLAETPGSFHAVADQIVSFLENPASSIDEKKLELGRQARRQALESFRKYAQDLEREDIKRAGIRALE